MHHEYIYGYLYSRFALAYFLFASQPRQLNLPINLGVYAFDSNVTVKTTFGRRDSISTTTLLRD